jgi:hypothetical protein
MMENKGRILLAIDGGTKDSAYMVVDEENYKIVQSGKCLNSVVAQLVRDGYYDDLTIEGITSYGQPIGQETLDTVFFNGRLYQIGLFREIVATIIPRKDIKRYFEVERGANADAFIRRTLIDRFAQFDKIRGKGTAKNPDWFYGVTADRWSAYALATVWIDRKKGI